MGELKFKRYEGFVGGGTGTKFIDENFKVCPMCHTHEPVWSTASEMHGVGGADVFTKSFGYVKCEKCNAIYKHKIIDIVKFTDKNALRTPFGKRIDPGSMDVNDIEMEIHDAGNSEGAEKYLGKIFTVRMMNSDVLRVEEGHEPNPSDKEAYAEAHGSSAITYIKDAINKETVKDLKENKEKINNGICPKCGKEFDKDDDTITFCQQCGHQFKENSRRNICITCGSTLDENGNCPKCSGAPVKEQPIVEAPSQEQEEKEPPKVWEIFAKIGFIIGIVTIASSVTLILSALAFSIGPVGIVLSALAKKCKYNIKKAKIGFTLSLIGTIVGFILYIVLLVLAGI